MEKTELNNKLSREAKMDQALKKYGLRLAYFNADIIGEWSFDEFKKKFDEHPVIGAKLKEIHAIFTDNKGTAKKK